MFRYKTISFVATALLVGAANSASAKGCNGHVEPLRWGCAAWDNNNGPNYPYYKAPARQQAQPTVPQTALASHSLTVPLSSVRGYPVGSTVVVNGVAYKLISQDGGGFAHLIATGGGN
jgi:hypothetical protein